MAKKATTKSGSEGVHSGTANPIFDMLENISKSTAIVLEKDDSDVSYIDTGVYIFNALMSCSIKNGGIPSNTITVLAGDPQTGKSFILYNVARNAQKDGYFVVFIDTEQSVDKNKLKAFGIETDSSKLALIRSNNVEDLKITLTKMITSLKEQKLAGKETPKTIILLDSIGQLASQKEIDDANEGKNKADMSRAKAIKSLFRIINSDLGYLNIPLLATNHIYLCITEKHEVLMSDNSYKFIKDIKIGDFVKTIIGDKEVLNTSKYEKCLIVKLTLEDGTELECTPNHKFLVTTEWSESENDECWKTADELLEEDYILTHDTANNSYDKLKIVKKEYLDEFKTTYDIEVADTHHYILKNNIVSHNSMDLFPVAIMSGGKGAEYSASTIVYLSASKQKDDRSDEMSLGSDGAIITAKSRKNRHAKPKKIKFSIDHERGLNPFDGLELFCTKENFDKVGIAKVKPIKDKTGNITGYENGSKWYVKHLDKTLFDSQLYNSQVFTKDVIDALDPIIIDYFRYGSYEEQQKENAILDAEYSNFEKDDDFDMDSDDMSNKLFDKEI